MEIWKKVKGFENFYEVSNSEKYEQYKNKWERNYKKEIEITGQWQLNNKTVMCV